MVILCVTCTKNVTQERFPGIKCGSCLKAFHIKCVGVSDELVKNINSGSATWLCPTCRSSSRKSVIDYSDPVAADVPSNPTLHDVMAILTSLQSKLTDLENSQQYINNFMEELSNRVSSLASGNATINKKVKQMEKNLDEYESKLSTLEANQDAPNQVEVSRNIVVCGLPSESDNVNNLFINATNQIGQQISSEDITSIRKIKQNNDGSNALKNAFIITLKTLELKQTILTNFRRKKTLYLDELDGKFDKTRIFMLHHFTKFQSKFYNEAKKFKVKFNFRVLWCTSNRILLRNLPDSEVHHIRSFYDITRLQRSFSE